MNILFIHQNFPGQFKFLAPALAELGSNVVALTMQEVPNKNIGLIKAFSYKPTRGTSKGIHPWLSDFETKVIRGEACFTACLALKKQGFYPDIVIAHPGWGESLFVKEVWEETRLGIYCEFFYRSRGADVGFDPEFSDTTNDFYCRLRLKNLSYLAHVEIADSALCPTRWQADSFPEPLKKLITVIHDGIDTRVAIPREDVRLFLNGSKGLSRREEVITFVNRNLEPYRGYHIFMRSLPLLLRRRPELQVLIIGGDGVSYGQKASNGGSWRDIFAEEVRAEISDADWSRVHFLGNIPYEQFISVLQLSSVHVYLTYPFVLSWSLLEAMSCGCAIVASDTSPVREVIFENETGRLFDFFDCESLVSLIIELLNDPAMRIRLGKNARAFVSENYELREICLPKQIKWINELKL
jgi:glycosyltransferase involved in cell wall biosynthesis